MLLTESLVTGSGPFFATQNLSAERGRVWCNIVRFLKRIQSLTKGLHQLTLKSSQIPSKHQSAQSIPTIQLPKHLLSEILASISFLVSYPIAWDYVSNDLGFLSSVKHDGILEIVQSYVSVTQNNLNITEIGLNDLTLQARGSDSKPNPQTLPTGLKGGMFLECLGR